ncbi:MAG: GntP family permease [Acidobacteria bacterium]|nr:MAG: GntP family permease [Acidobacteriota bacterium]
MFLILLLVVAIAALILATNRLNLHPFLALLFVAIGYGLLAGMPLDRVAASLNEGFGSTVGHIGILIVAGTIIGTFLERSGGAFALAERIIRVIGERRVPVAMALIGWLVSIPVFADSGFVILQPLNRALTKRANLSLAATAIALCLGLMATHTLVPPTPGPVAAAGILQADLGLVILFGLPVSLFAALVGWFWATRVAARVDIDPISELTEQEVVEKASHAPHPLRALLPLLVPILLIVLKSVAQLPSVPLGTGFGQRLLMFVGEPAIALLLGVLLAFMLPRRLTAEMVSTSGWVGKGMVNAAIIILITGAGGSFGKVLQNSGIGELIGERLADAHLGIWLPFLLAAALKTAQGSSTVAIITTSSLLSPLMGSLGFDEPLARAFIVLTIGAGSMVASHVNDSYFWVVTQMSNMNVPTGYKLHTLGSVVIGTATGVLLWVVSFFAF